MSKAPSITQSENLPPWQWRKEKSPKHTNAGPALNVSVNTSDPYPCIEDGKETQVGCLENKPSALVPASATQPVIPLRLADVLEDGRETQMTESRCVENLSQERVPQQGNREVLRPEAGLVLESIKTAKAPT